MAIGMKKGDRIATVSGNRPEWSFVDMALAMSGAVHVPVYPTISEEEYRYIFSHAETRFIFVSDDKLYKKLSPMVGHITSLEQVFTFNQVPELPILNIYFIWVRKMKVRFRLTSNK